MLSSYAPIISAEKAAFLLKDKMVVGTSGFTKAGDSKAVLPAFAKVMGSYFDPIFAKLFDTLMKFAVCYPLTLSLCTYSIVLFARHLLVN